MGKGEGGRKATQKKEDEAETTKAKGKKEERGECVESSLVYKLTANAASFGTIVGGRNHKVGLVPFDPILWPVHARAKAPHAWMLRVHQA